MTGSVDAALTAGIAELRRAGISAAQLDAEALLSTLLGVDRGGLLTRRHDPLPGDQAERYEKWIRRRAGREPLQHITGTQEFHGLAFAIDRRALVPRPETEGLVDAALALDLPRRARVADLGTGSGCIAITLAVKRRGLEIDALDIAPEALDLARENARRHGVEGRIRFVEADLRTPPADWRGRIDLVTCNPPYVSESEWERLEPEVRDHDPRGALVAGPTGLEAYAALAPVALDLLRPGGYLLLELGFGQSGAVSRLLADAGFEGIDVRPDLRGIPRVASATRPSS